MSTTERPFRPLCSEAALRDAMTDAEFWEHVLLAGAPDWDRYEVDGPGADDGLVSTMAERWRLDLICCGHAAGHVVRETWTEADEFRQSYERTEGHEGQAILVEDFAHDRQCNGYSDDCPLPGGSFLGTT